MFGERVQRIPYTGLVEGPHGSRSSWGDPVDVEGAGFDPGGSAMVDGTARTSNPTLYFLGAGPPGVREQDNWQVRGRVYRTVGYPALWVNPFTGWVAGVVIELERVVG